MMKFFASLLVLGLLVVSSSGSSSAGNGYRGTSTYNATGGAVTISVYRTSDCSGKPSEVEKYTTGKCYKELNDPSESFIYFCDGKTWSAKGWDGSSDCTGTFDTHSGKVGECRDNGKITC